MGETISSSPVSRSGPRKQNLQNGFAAQGTQPMAFVLAKPRVIDAKNVSIHQGKTIHLKGSAYLGSLSSSVIQIYFYTLLESVKIFANAEAAKRYAFLKAFQIRACG
jgi:hypothetical protein